MAEPHVAAALSNSLESGFFQGGEDLARFERTELRHLQEAFAHPQTQLAPVGRHPPKQVPQPLSYFP